MCTAGLMILSESWLNDMADNRSRGQLLGIYTILSWGAPVLGVASLRFGDIEGPTMFLLASVLISIGAVPILLSASRTPGFIEYERLGIARLYRITPLGVTATGLTGLCHGAFFALVAVFGNAVGLDAAQTATLTAIALGGGVLTQWPIALLSDRFDRRLCCA